MNNEMYVVRHYGCHNDIYFIIEAMRIIYLDLTKFPNLG